MSTGLNLLKLKHELGFVPRTILDVGAQIGDFYRECKESMARFTDYDDRSNTRM